MLRDAYFNPQYLNNGGIDAIIQGLLSQPEQEVDGAMVDDLRHFVEGLPQDLAAIDIQRGKRSWNPFIQRCSKIFWTICSESVY